MTIVSSIINSAFRESGILALGESPTTTMSTEALERLNVLVRSTLGYEVGENLTSCNYIDYFKNVVDNQYIPENSRVFFELEEDTTIYLDPRPSDGARFAIHDMAGNLSTHNLTIDGNGRNIEGDYALILTTNYTTREWLYRADTGDWARISDLQLGDTFPFPTEFDDFFSTLLAMRLNPRYGQEIPVVVLEVLRRSEKRLKSRYAQTREEFLELGLTHFSSNKWGHFINGFDRGSTWNY